MTGGGATAPLAPPLATAMPTLENLEGLRGRGVYVPIL